MSAEAKKRISEGMKAAHGSGRLSLIGRKRLPHDARRIGTWLLNAVPQPSTNVYTELPTYSESPDVYNYYYDAPYGYGYPYGYAYPGYGFYPYYSAPFFGFGLPRWAWPL